MQSREYSDAAAEFAQAVALAPENDQLRVQYAACLFAAERNDEARKQFEIERRRLGEQPGLNYYLGQLDLRANDFASAIKKLTPLESVPGLSKSSLYLGLAYQALGQQARALECLERAAKGNPQDPEVHYRLARAYAAAARGADADAEYKLYRASHELQRLVEEEGQECLDALRSKPIEAARPVCQRLSDPADSRRMAFLGQLYAEHGAFADAVEPLRQAVRLDPNLVDAWQSLGLSLYRLQRYREALPAARKAAELNPQFFDALVLLASTLHALGDDRAALPVLEQAHTLNPDDAHWTQVLEQLRATVAKKKN